MCHWTGSIQTSLYLRTMFVDWRSSIQTSLHLRTMFVNLRTMFV